MWTALVRTPSGRNVIWHSALDTDLIYAMRIEACPLRPGEMMFIVALAAEVRPVGVSGSCIWSLPIRTFVTDAQLDLSSKVSLYPSNAQLSHLSLAMRPAVRSPS